MNNPLTTLVLVLALAPLTGQAAVTSVTVDPGQAAVPATGPASLSLSWRVERNISASTGANAGPQVTSEKGRFLDATGQVLAQVERRLRQSRPVSGTGVDRFLFRETVSVPANLRYRLGKVGSGRLYYSRSFDDGFGATSATVALDLTTSAAAGFGISRLALAFDDGWVSRVVESGAPLRPRARLAFSGSGQLRALWEVAGPVTASGAVVFRPLRNVRRYLAGGGSELIDGPDLPTARPGTYLVRLRLESPQAGFEAPRLRYVVMAPAIRVAPVEVREPAPGARLTPDTPFAWQPVNGAHHYLVEFFEEDGERAVTGVVVSEPATTLPATTRAHLEAGNRYQWRVRALDDGGRLLAESARRPLDTAP